MTRDRMEEEPKGTLYYAERIEKNVSEAQAAAWETADVMRSILRELEGWRAESQQQIQTLIRYQVWAAIFLAAILWRVW